MAETLPRGRGREGWREPRRRRTALLTLATLLVLGMSPLLGHHLLLGGLAPLEGRDHLWALCLIALHMLMDPVHLGFHLLLAGGLAWATWDRLRAWRSAVRVLAPLEAAPPVGGGAIARAATAAGLGPEQLRVVVGLPAPAFTTGLLRPRIYVAAELPEHLTAEELAAVLAHEAVHLRRLDPLRLSVLRFLACTLFWLPALRRLASDVADEGEVRADDAAAERHGLALASALVRLAGWRRSGHALGVGFTGGDLLERRVLRLTGEAPPHRSHVTRRSLAGAAAALLLAWTSGLAVAHPLPGGHHGHCDHHSGSALVHLFCSPCRHGAAESCAWHP